MASDDSRRRIRDRIAALPENERRQLYKRAANMRRTAQSGRAKLEHRPNYMEWGEDNAPPALEKRKRRHKGSLRQWAESLVEDDDFGAGEPLTVPTPTNQGLVLFATTGQCQVLLASDEVVECPVAADLAAVQRSHLAVGDRVGIATESDVPTIVEVLPRTSVLSRPDSGPGGRYVERVVAANVDRVVVVAAAKQPPLRTRIIDTPGVREFGLWQLSRDELRAYFHEFDELTSGCRYRDCSHLHEPDCLVRDAAESGVLPASRYDSYRRLMAALPRCSE